MTIKGKTFVAILAASSVMAFSASADDNQNLRSWAKDAGQEISSAMIYPRIAERQGRTGSTQFHVTINRDGDIVGYEAIGAKSRATFRSASKRALKRVDFPALPDSYQGEQLTFSLSLYYKTESDLQREKFRASGRNRGSVTGTRIAFLPTNVPVAAK